MKFWHLFIAFVGLALSTSAQFNFKDVVNDAKDAVTGTDSKDLSNAEIIEGLKEALSVGTDNATNLAAKVDGYYKNPEIFIPFPPEAREMESTLRNLGMGKQVDEFIQTLNRAAEEAAKEAAPIFLNAIKQMTINDGLSILNGADDPSTQFLDDKTSAQLMVKFEPIVKRALEKVQVTRYWNPLVTRYNKIPFVKKQNPDLEEYTTQKAIDGLFILLAKEEKKIRTDPAARITDILRKVFG